MSSGEYIVSCWKCAVDFDLATAMWCGCSTVAPSKLCPFCYTCSCSASDEYREALWGGAPTWLVDERKQFSPPKERLGEILIRKGLVTDDQLKQALRVQRTRKLPLGAILIKLGFLSEDEVTRTLSDQFGMWSVDLTKQEIDHELVREIGLPTCLRFGILPLEKESIQTTNRPMLILAVARPMTADDIGRLEELLGARIYPVKAADSEVNAVLKELLRQEEERQAIKAGEPVDGAPPGRPPNEAAGRATGEGLAGDLGEASEEALRAMKMMVAKAIRLGASDLHVEESAAGCRIRARREGEVLDLGESTETPRGLAAALGKLVGLRTVADHRPTRGRRRVRVGNDSVELVVVALRTGAEAVQLRARLIREEDYVRDLPLLGLAEHLTLVREMLDRPRGLVLVAGPASATRQAIVYAFLRSLSQNGRKVMSLESPVLVKLDTVEQIDLDDASASELADRLRHLAELEPDALATPELDRSLLDAVLRAAGRHVVVSPASAPTALDVFRELAAMGAPAAELGERLVGILCQRKVPANCPHCTRSEDVSHDDLLGLGFAPTELDTLVAYRGKGCEKCNQTGVIGEQVVVELFIPDDAARQSIATGQPAAAMLARAGGRRFVSFAAAVRGKVRGGRISVASGRRLLEDAAIAAERQAVGG